MGTLDIILIIPIVYGFYKGYKKGLVFSFISLISVVLGIFLSIKFSSVLEVYIRNEQLVAEKYVSIISFVIMFLGTILILNLIGKILEKILKTVHLESINKILGGVFGLIKFFFILSVLIFFMERVDQLVTFIPEETKGESKIYQYGLQLSNFILPKIFSQLSINPILIP